MPQNDILVKEELSERFLNVENYLVVAAALVPSTVIGGYFWWHGHKDNDDYLMGGRNMPVLPVALSLATSFFSAVTMLGIPSMMYIVGTQYGLVFFSTLLQVWITTKFFMPVFVNLRLTSVYEYLELRFHSKALRSIASGYFVLTMLLYLSVVVYAPSLVLAQVSGVHVYISCFALFLLCGAYTGLGGLKAVLWADAFQFFVMLGAYIVLAYFGTMKLDGGMAEVFDRNFQTERMPYVNFDPDMRVTYTVWSLVIGNTFTGVHMFAVCQTQVQRYLSCKSEAGAKRALWWNAVAMTSLALVSMYMGMLIVAFYDDCDPLNARLVSKVDQLVPLFVLQTMSDRGVPGLLVAGLLCATLSTVSSGLNSLATVVVHDGFRSFGYLSNEDPQKTQQRLVMTRAIAAIFCIICYLLTFMVDLLPSALKACLGILELVAGPVLGVFTLGMFVPFANGCGATTGFATGVVFSLWMFIGHEVASATGVLGCSNYHPPKSLSTDGCPASWNATASYEPPVCPAWHLPLYDLSFLWPPSIVTLWVIVFGALVSLCTKPLNPIMVPAELISPAAKTLFGWYPSLLRKPLEAYFATVGSALQSDILESVNDRASLRSY